MIRKLEEKDMDSVMNIWLNGNLEAHPFVPKEYWVSNCAMVREQIPQTDVYISEEKGEVQGFIGIAEGYIAGIFVDKRFRSGGVGKALLCRAKERYGLLSLNVFEENRRAAAFYRREGFQIAKKGLDEETGKAEYRMEWRKTD